MHCSSRGRFIQAYQDIARKLNLPGCDGPQSDTARLVSEWLSEASNGVWLMILDNADDLDILLNEGGLCFQRCHVLPSHQLCSAYVTWFDRNNHKGQTLERKVSRQGATGDTRTHAFDRG